MEIKYSKDLNHIRSLFERLVSLPHKVNVAKGFFKKYFEFEQKFGDVAS